MIIVLCLMIMFKSAPVIMWQTVKQSSTEHKVIKIIFCTLLYSSAFSALANIDA